MVFAFYLYQISEEAYDLTKSEGLKVMLLIDDEPDIQRKGWHKNLVEYRIQDPKEMKSITVRLQDEAMDLYDEKDDALQLLRHKLLPGLVYSLAQARKIATDLVNILQHKEMPKKVQEGLLEAYVRAHKGYIADRRDPGRWHPSSGPLI